MSILKKELNAPKTPQQVKAEKLANVIADIEGMTRNCYGFLSNTQIRGIDLLWNNKNFMPQEILDELGTDALKIFQFHGLLTELLIQLSAIDGIAPTIKLPNNAWTVNPDGTITVSEDPYVIPS